VAELEGSVDLTDGAWFCVISFGPREGEDWTIAQVKETPFSRLLNSKKKEDYPLLPS
jgi:hypothetical protein